MVRGKALVIGALFVLCGCGPDWTTVHRGDAGFLMEMPGNAVCTGARIATAMGALIGRQCFVIESSKRFAYPYPYGVVWYDVPAMPGGEGAAALFHEVETRWQPPGHSWSEGPASLGGERGLQYEGIANYGAGTVHFRDRMCVHKARIYRLTMNGDPDAAGERDWARMVDSFRFTP